MAVSEMWYAADRHSRIGSITKGFWYRCSVLLLALGSNLFATTSVDIVDTTVAKGDELTVTVTGDLSDDLSEIEVQINWDPEFFSFVADSFAGESRMTLPEATLSNDETGLFVSTGSIAGDATVTEGEGTLFTFRLLALKKTDSTSLTVSDLAAQRYFPSQPEAVFSEGAVISILGPGPIVFSPNGGTLSSSTSIMMESLDATTIHYTINNASPVTTSDPSVTPGGTVVVDGSNGDTVTLKALAVDGAGRQEIGDATYIMDLPPVATISAIVPNPRNTLVAGATIVFSEPVAGFDVDDISLTRDGNSVVLAGLGLSTSDNEITWTLTGLTPYTALEGGYVLTVGTDVVDQDLEPTGVVNEATVAWTMDLTAPEVAVSIASAPTNDPTPVISGTIDDPSASIVAYLFDSQDTEVQGPLDATNLGSTWTLEVPTDLADGVYDVRVTATDLAGNAGDDVTNDELEVDLEDPTGTFFIGSGNPQYVNDLSVTLDVMVDGAAMMRFRNSGDQFGAFEAYADKRPNWVLKNTAADGERTVFAEFKDAAGNVLGDQDPLPEEIVSDSVILDREIPVSIPGTAGLFGPGTWLGAVTGSASDGAGGGSGVSRVEVLVTRASDGYAWSGSSWVDSESWVLAGGTVAWSLAIPGTELGNGDVYTLKSRAFDVAGNFEDGTSQSVFSYDSAPPEGSFVVGVGDPDYVTASDRAVELDLDGIVNGAVEMQFRIGDAGLFSDWEAFPSNDPKRKTIVLANLDGEQRVEGRFRDAQLNVLDAFDLVILDREAPRSQPTTSGGVGRPINWDGKVVGVATDATSGMNQGKVMVQVQRPVNPEAYWNSVTEAWVSDPVFNLANGTENWSVDLPYGEISGIGDDVTYTIRSLATDNAGLVETTASESFFIFDSRVPSGGVDIVATTGSMSYTNSIVVDLVSDVSFPVGPNHWMRFGNDGSLGAFQSYAETISNWVLDGAADGVKSVSFEYRDQGADASPPVPGPGLLVLAVTREITLDRAPPMSSVTSVTAGDRYGPADWGGAFFGDSGDGLSGVASVELSILGPNAKYWDTAGTPGFTSGPAVFHPADGSLAWSLQFLAGSMGDGSYTVSSRATDLAGNVSSPASVSFIFDQSPPDGTFLVNQGAANTNVLEVSLSSVVTDDAGVDRMRFRNEGGSFGAWLSYDAGPMSWMLTGGDGDKLIYAQFRDGVGNVLEKSASIRLDTIAPDTTVTSVGFFGEATWGSVTGTISDAGSGAASVAVSVYDTEDETYWDTAANGGSGGWVPEVVLLPASLNGANWSLALDFADLIPGRSYTVVSIGTDAIGNVATTGSSGDFAIDATAPTSVAIVESVYGPNSWPDAISGTVSDQESGVAAVEVALIRRSDSRSWDGTKWLHPSGGTAWFTATGNNAWSRVYSGVDFQHDAGYDVATRATDNVGNLELVDFDALVGFSYDSEGPSPSISSEEASPSMASSIDFTVTFSEVVVGFQQTDLQVTNGTVTHFSESEIGTKWVLSVSPVDDGDVTVSVPADVATDAVGNANVSADGTVKSDQTPPTVTIGRSPDQEFHNGNYTLTIDGGDGDTVIYSLDEWVTEETYVNPIILSAEQRYTIDARSIDTAGNVGEATQVVAEIDLTPPVTSSAIVYDGDVVGSDLSIQADATSLSANWAGFSDSNGISYYEWALGTASDPDLIAGFDLVGASESAVMNNLSLSDCVTYVVTVRAYDHAGNSSTVASDGVVVDATAPSAVGAAVRDGVADDIDLQKDGSVISVNWSGFSDACGIVEYKWAIGVSGQLESIQSFASVGLAESASASGLGLVNGTTYLVTIRAYDQAGNFVEKSSNGVLADLVWRISGFVSYTGSASRSGMVEAIDTNGEIAGATAINSGNDSFTVVVSQPGTYGIRAYLSDEFDPAEPADFDTFPSVIVDDDIVLPEDLVLADWALDVPLEKGWNLLSIPGDALAGNQFSEVWPGTDRRYGFSASRRRIVRPDGVVALAGYWVASSTAQNLRVRGNYSGNQYQISRGWNLTGVRVPTAVSALDWAEAVFYYNGRRLVRMSDSDVLLPGYGYWGFSRSGFSQ